LTGSNQSVPPTREEVEISVFGPGYGESIVIHLGENNWIVVDSCLEPETDEAASLCYLRKIGVNAVDVVKQVIATHWHDDHIRGLASVVKTCSNATFVCSDALRGDEFLQLVDIYGQGVMLQSDELRPGLQEMGEVFAVLKRRRRESRANFSPRFATADRDLWQVDIAGRNNRTCRLRALSPSDASILAAKIDLADKLRPGYVSPKRCLPSPSPNHAAVVLWISVDGFSILLGSDLEESGDMNSGWSAIVSSTCRPTDRAAIFKVPHHGSRNGHHAGVWEEMLEAEPIAVVTPFQLGNQRLPTEKDVHRLTSLTRRSYVTAGFGRRGKKKRERTVEKTLQEMGVILRQRYDVFGHVRVRLDSAAQPRVELFGGALQLNMIYDTYTV
jgi:beta-lactamase superfamily II metal-dependent hydrolase